MTEFAPEALTPASLIAPERPAVSLAQQRRINDNGRIADIEMLRGIAVIFVMLHHARDNLFAWPTRFMDALFAYAAFWSGVDLFFAISGFVIARSLLPTLDGSQDLADSVRSTLAFWTRRAWRLLPSAWLWLALPLFCSIAFNRSSAFGSFTDNLATDMAAFANVENYHLATVFGSSGQVTSFAYWSLSLEEQFYLLLPIAAFLLRRHLGWLAGGLIVLQLFQTRGLWLMMMRTDAILLGVLLAIWSRGRIYRLFEPTGLLASRAAGPALLVAALFCLAFLSSDQLGVVSFRVGLIALIAAGLVAIASYDRDYLWPKGWSKHVMMWVGSRSYGLYLIHVPAYFMTREFWFRLQPDGVPLGPADTPQVAATALPLLLLLSEANYRLVETPLRRHGAELAARILGRPAALPAAAE
jgi:peptidoglycan/LPS O-acetylase OafA/YrhL